MSYFYNLYLYLAWVLHELEHSSLLIEYPIEAERSGLKEHEYSLLVETIEDLMD